MTRIHSPKLADVARSAKVSLATAERALHGRPGVSEVTRANVLRVAASLNYHPNLAARALATNGREIRIGVCVPEYLRFFFDELRMGIQDELSRFSDYGISLVCSSPRGIEDDIEPHLTRLMKDNVQGLIVTPTGHTSSAAAISCVVERGVRVVCCPTDMPGIPPHAAISIDPHLSGQLAAELLGTFLPAGASVAMLTGSRNVVQHNAKVTSFTQSFAHFCHNGRIEQVIYGHDDPILTYQVMESFFSEHQTVAGLYVTTANCQAVCRSIQKRNLKGKVLVVTTDIFPEMIPFLEDGTILASLFQNPARLGRTAMSLLINSLLFHQPSDMSYCFPPEIIMASNLRSFRDARR